MGFLQSLFQIRKRPEARLFELGDPPFIDFLERNWIEEVEFLPAIPHRGDQVRSHQQVKVLRYTLPCHIQVFAQLIERAAIVFMQQIQQLAPAGVGQSLEEHIWVMSIGHLVNHASVYLPI